MLACGTPAATAEVTALVSNALKTTLPELAPTFEKTTGHTHHRQPGAAKALLELLLSRDSARVMKAKGLEPAS